MRYSNHGEIAQLAELPAVNRKDVSSNLIFSSGKAGVKVSIPVCDAGDMGSNPMLYPG